MLLIAYKKTKDTTMKKALNEPYKQFFGTLANQVRLDIIKHLRKKESNVTEIVKATNHTQSTVSHSLARLEECGFVTVKQEGKNRTYTINQKTIGPLFELMEKHMNAYCKHVVARRNKNGTNICH